MLDPDPYNPQDFLASRGIPPAPSDPEGRRLWKIKYHASLYGAGPKQIEALMASAIRERAEYRRLRRQRIRIAASLLCVGVAIILITLYLTQP